MDNINIVVLIVALVFVAAGVALIALSAVVGRGTPATTGAAELSEGPDKKPADEEDDVLFIDEPLTTDLAEELAEVERGRRSATADSDGLAEAAVAEAEAETDVEAEEPAEAEAETGALPGEAEADAPRSDYDFSVRLGFKYLESRLFTEAAAEFHKAVALTDQREEKLSLYTRIGDKLRDQGMNGAACASYLQATAYTDDPDVRDRLERAIDDMTDTEPTAGDSPGSSRDEEE